MPIQFSMRITSKLNGPFRTLEQSRGEGRNDVEVAQAAHDDAVSKFEFAQAKVIIGPAAWRPPKFAVGFGNGTVVDTCVAHGHKPVFVEFPVFIAIRAEPVASIVVPFIGEPDGDAVAVVRPQLLDEPVVEFAYPFAFEKRDDLLAALRKLAAIAPPAVGRICERYAHRVAAVPGVFGQANLVYRRLAREGGQGRSRGVDCGIHGRTFVMDDGGGPEPVAPLS